MGCIYEDRMEGLCSLATNHDGEYEKELEQQGSENGFCVVSDDPNPADNCENYESDWSCNECGADLNVEECSCDEED